MVNREELPSLAAGAGRVLHGLKTEIPHEPAIPGIPVRSHPDFRPSGLVRSAPPLRMIFPFPAFLKGLPAEIVFA